MILLTAAKVARDVVDEAEANAFKRKSKYVLLFYRH
jgi:hypothetical protein